MKRFWRDVTIHAETHGWRVLLDGKPVSLPDIGALRFSHQALAEAVAAEWRVGEVGSSFEIQEMKLTRLSATAQSCVGAVRTDIATQIGRYAETDLLCYRSDQPSLAARQVTLWQPWIDWAERHYDVAFCVTDALMPIAQPPDTIETLQNRVNALEPEPLACLAMIAPAFGSLILGLAVVDRQINPLSAYALTGLDEDWQAEKWGMDPSVVERRAEMAADLRMVDVFLSTVRI
jgi:chaperone required for assembly of F1-ATPase